MTIRTAFLNVLLGLHFAIVAVPALAQPELWEAELGVNPNASYSATRTMTTPMGVFTAQERQRPGMQSVELAVAGMQSRIIVREDLGLSYALLPAMKSYREMPQEEGENQAGQSADFASVEQVGRETIAGHSATKYRAQFTDETGQGTGLVWVTDTGVMIKVDMTYSGAGVSGSEFSSELSNLVMGPQPLNHFEIPDGYQPLDVGAMLGLLGAAPAGGNGQTMSPADVLTGLTQQGVQPPPPSQSGGQAPNAVASSVVAADSASDSVSDDASVAPGTSSGVADEVTAAAGEVVDAAAEEAKTGLVENTRETIRDGIRGLFRRKD